MLKIIKYTPYFHFLIAYTLWEALTKLLIPKIRFGCNVNIFLFPIILHFRVFWYGCQYCLKLFYQNGVRRERKSDFLIARPSFAYESCQKPTPYTPQKRYFGVFYWLENNMIGSDLGEIGVGVGFGLVSNCIYIEHTRGKYALPCISISIKRVSLP